MVIIAARMASTLRVEPGRAILIALLLPLVTGCRDEFSNSPTVPITVTEAATWPQELMVGDYDTVEIRISDAGGSEIRPRTVVWASSDPGVLLVTRLPPQTATIGDSLLTQLRAEIRGVSRGPVTISVSVPEQAGLHGLDTTVTLRVMEHWASVSAGSNYVCAATINGAAYCWGGSLTAGVALGKGSRAGSTTPEPVLSSSPLHQISAGFQHACVLSFASGPGPAVCWGENSSGALGIGNTQTQLVPQTVSGGNAFSQISAGARATCAIDPLVPISLDPNGTVQSNLFCWGGPFPGVSGLVPTASAIPGSFIANSVNFVLKSVSVGYSHGCGIVSIFGTNNAYCWGSGSSGQLGDSLFQDHTTPTKLKGALDFTAISAGMDHSCGITTPDKRALCWGNNGVGQIGRSFTEGNRFGSPVEVDGRGLRFIAITAGGQNSVGGGYTSQTCAIGTDSLAYCWGSNRYGELGIGVVGPDQCALPCSSRPRLVDPLLHFRIITIASGSFSGAISTTIICALTGRGAIYCWGSNFSGEMGNPRATPPGFKTATRICEPPDAGGYVFCPLPPTGTAQLDRQ